MKIQMLEHVNLMTTDVERLEIWYTRILGLQSGYRPPFPSEGRWMYAGDWPMVHLRKSLNEKNNSDPQIDHFAMRAAGLKEFLELLDREGIPYEKRRAPELMTIQIFLQDPDGNTMHIDFKPEEDF